MYGKVLSPTELASLVPLLRERGYTVIGPVIRDDVIQFDEIASLEELPIGWTDHQEAGTYRLEKRKDRAYFGYTVGSRPLKHYLFPPRQTMLTITREETGLRFAPEPTPTTRYAFFGVRSCELEAVAIQDKVFAGSDYPDPSYTALRAASFTIGVNCGTATSTCFCSSMDTGPRCTNGYDLVVTEVISDQIHEFVVEPGTAQGGEVLSRLDGREKLDADAAVVDQIVAQTTQRMTNRAAVDTAYDTLVTNLEHPLWDEVATRCLSCTSCTLVCPTCFCSTTSDATDFEGTASRSRSWDSCFNMEFTYLHGHPVRSATRSKYRQWITHKFAYWHDQFDTSGCVGCGRCITWCPAHIDVTEELERLRADAEAHV